MKKLQVVVVKLSNSFEKLWPKMIYFEVEHQAAWGLPLMERLAACGYVEIESFGKNRLMRRGG